MGGGGVLVMMMMTMNVIAIAIIILHLFLVLPPLFGLVVKASASRAKDPGFESRLRQDFPGPVIPVT